MSWFQHIILVSSSQDKYVPRASARFEVDDSKPNFSAYRKMCKNFLRSLKIDNLYRVDVEFDTDSSGTLDRLIGRSAHINFIENENLAKMLLNRYGEFFI